MDAARARKLADRISQIVAEMLERRIKDPRLGFVTVTGSLAAGGCSLQVEADVPEVEITQHDVTFQGVGSTTAGAGDVALARSFSQLSTLRFPRFGAECAKRAPQGP